MKLRRKKRPEAATWMIIAGVVATGAAAAFAITRVLRSDAVTERRDRLALARRVVRALREDEETSEMAIDVIGVGRDVVELSGSVETEQEARRAIERADAVPGVHAVVNRLEIRTLETKLTRNRQKASDQAVRWYGGSIGIGRRRQSFITDPPRRDDRVDLLSRSLEPNRDETLSAVEEAEGTGVRIRVSNATSLTTEAPPPPPNPEELEPPPPPAIAPHERAQSE